MKVQLKKMYGSNLSSCIKHDAMAEKSIQFKESDMVIAILTCEVVTIILIDLLMVMAKQDYQGSANFRLKF